MRIRYWTVLVACLCLGLAACGDSDDGNNGNNGGNNGGQELSAQMVDCASATIASEVSVVDNEFDPTDTTIQSGEVVRWSVTGSNTHTVTSGEAGASDAGALFDSGNVTTNDTFCVRFENPGSYDYHCIPHAPSMAGTVTVE
jgi:plastocyanin